MSTTGDAAATLLGELARIGGGSVTITLSTGTAPSASPAGTGKLAPELVGTTTPELVGTTTIDQTGRRGPWFNGYPVDEWLARQMWTAEQEVRPPVDGMTMPWAQLSQPERLMRLAQARWMIEHGVVRVPR